MLAGRDRILAFWTYFGSFLVPALRFIRISPRSPFSASLRSGTFSFLAPVASDQENQEDQEDEQHQAPDRGHHWDEDAEV